MFIGKTLDEITPEAVERFKLDLVQMRTKATVNRHLALLRHLFNRRIEDFGHPGRNPVRKRTMFSEQNTRTRWLSPEEEDTLLAVIPAPYAAFCKVALYTGARRGELLVARWDQVDGKRGLLTLPTSKSGKPRYIELSSVVLDTLARVPHHLGEPRIFPDCRKVTHHFPAWVEAAGLPGKVTLHTLRHTYRQPARAGWCGLSDDPGARRLVGEGGPQPGAAVRARRGGAQAGGGRGPSARGAAGAH